ncbi:hypothetical protein Syun_015055 [Stephania yunnanensis]|uniref:Uncharacterized protein n=1 Tax=Stephania yunnanensis TaxID=152371 RepID=A0AAP0JLC5_9MAGN
MCIKRNKEVYGSATMVQEENWMMLSCVIREHNIAYDQFEGNQNLAFLYEQLKGNNNISKGQI